MVYNLLTSKIIQLRSHGSRETKFIASHPANQPPGARIPNMLEKLWAGGDYGNMESEAAAEGGIDSRGSSV